MLEKFVQISTLSPSKKQQTTAIFSMIYNVHNLQSLVEHKKKRTLQTAKARSGND